MNSTSNLLDNFNRQLAAWPLARNNFEALGAVQTREFIFGDFPLILQFNPARIRSTTAKVDTASIAERKCFLCAENRPSEQVSLEETDQWLVLANPYPIFSPHFTIVSKQHQDQDNIDFAHMALFAARHPGLVAFYNGSCSGASCPDHLHFQAIATSALPLCKIVEGDPGSTLSKEGNFTVYIPEFLPVNALHFITPAPSERPESAGPQSVTYAERLSRWLTLTLPANPAEGIACMKGMRNLLMWVDDSGRLHTILFPRSKHRPDIYHLPDGAPRQALISPGAIDMAGVVILPRREDFLKLNKFDVARALMEVSYDFRESAGFKSLLVQ